MLSVGYQDRSGSYDAFVRFWDGIALVGIDSILPLGRATGSESGVTIEANLWFDVIGGNRSFEIIHIDVGVVDGALLITDYRFIRKA